MPDQPVTVRSPWHAARILHLGATVSRPDTSSVIVDIPRLSFAAASQRRALPEAANIVMRRAPHIRSGHRYHWQLRVARDIARMENQ